MRRKIFGSFATIAGSVTDNLLTLVFAIFRARRGLGLVVDLGLNFTDELPSSKTRKPAMGSPAFFFALTSLAPAAWDAWREASRGSTRGA